MRIKRHHPPHEENSHAVPTPCPLPNCNPLAYEYQGAEPTYHSSFLPAQGRTHHMLHTNPSHAPVLQNTLPPSSLMRSISTCTESESHSKYVDYNTNSRRRWRRWCRWQALRSLVAYATNENNSRLEDWLLSSIMALLSLSSIWPHSFTWAWDCGARFLCHRPLAFLSRRGFRFIFCRGFATKATHLWKACDVLSLTPWTPSSLWSAWKSCNFRFGNCSRGLINLPIDKFSRLLWCWLRVKNVNVVDSLARRRP